MLLLLLLLLSQELSVAREAAERSAKECTELSALLQPLRDEMTSVKTRLTEAEKVASRVLQAEGNARYYTLFCQILVVSTCYIACHEY
jgi:hypothetical protein